MLASGREADLLFSPRNPTSRGRPPITSPDGPELLRIGMAAERAGVSPRTLRWYEEIGLLAPAGYSSGSARRYSQEDVDPIVHIYASGLAEFE